MTIQACIFLGYRRVDKLTSVNVFAEVPQD